MQPAPCCCIDYTRVRVSLYRSCSRCSSKLERRCAPAPSYCSARPQRLTVECTRCPMASVKRATHGKFVEVQARRRRIMIKAEALGARARLPLRRWARRAVSTTHGVGKETTAADACGRRRRDPFNTLGLQPLPRWRRPTRRNSCTSAMFRRGGRTPTTTNGAVPLPSHLRPAVCCSA